MTKFPEKPAEIVELSENMQAGLTNHHDVFPDPPVPVTDLKIKSTTYVKADTEVTEAEAVLEEKKQNRDVALVDLANGIKTNIHYAENVTKDDAKLRLIGWSGKRPRTPLHIPGQCRSLEVLKTEENLIILNWKVPKDGGKVAVYRIQRKESSSTTWEDAGIALTTEAKIEDQTRGKEYEYRVIAVNKAGDGDPSNTVRVVI
jgi:hypothetical protein